MKVYVEITLLPDVDISFNFLWQKVYQQLHLKFVEMQSTSPLPPFKGGELQPVGVSFPNYDTKANTLGNKIRLFAPHSEILEQFNAKQILRKLSDYVHVTNIRDVPSNVKTFACFQRLQLKTSNLRLARRKAKRENIDVESVLSNFQRVEELKTVEPPFLWIQSASNGEKFKLFVVYNELANDNVGGFGTYGLSSKSTVPIF
ncbi:MAG: type I-F CRISPR-associated endoribonuclease Cas6/Csy4 [Methylococcales bacterium]|nr:type I-F CRISPR-associated endoribonuclease Cas6/Csy4 [Methylococcales bacterium]MDD5753268.1 type I-F CRISPR-associated endoribonuclease Cas6/Csy4 [Methylococcales bacterium]